MVFLKNLPTGRKPFGWQEKMPVWNVAPAFRIALQKPSRYEPGWGVPMPLFIPA
jgi:hypothetical protein